MATQKTSGTQVATPGTEHALGAEITDAGAYQLTVDLAAIDQGDIVELWQETKVLTGGTRRKSLVGVFAHAQAAPNALAIPVEVLHAFQPILVHRQFKVTGTLTGAVAVGDTVTGSVSGATAIVAWVNSANTEWRLLKLNTTLFTDTENAEVDGSNYIDITDGTPGLSFPWEVIEL